jgi:hypothetical protein
MEGNVSTDITPQFDPSREVPDEYDVFCESCGYSLAGLATDRCPECGTTFEPKELPFARIPWLHRKRLGKVRAYLSTVRLVCFHPRQFSRELCRPVRISAKDARKFRMVTIHLATATFAFFPVATIVAVAVRFAFVSGRGVFNIRPFDITVMAIMGCAMSAAFNIFLRLATDLPVFIWKGHASLPPNELAPIHQYACAPLAMFPPLVFVACLGIFLAVIWDLSGNMPLAVTIVSVIASLSIPVWLLITALVLMHVSARPAPRRLLLLALYLPAHWLIMAAVSWLGLAAVIEAVNFVVTGKWIQ